MLIDLRTPPPVYLIGVCKGGLVLRTFQEWVIHVHLPSGRIVVQDPSLVILEGDTKEVNLTPLINVPIGQNFVFSVAPSETEVSGLIGICRMDRVSGGLILSIDNLGKIIDPDFSCRNEVKTPIQEGTPFKEVIRTRWERQI